LLFGYFVFVVQSGFVQPLRREKEVLVVFGKDGLFMLRCAGL
jgi:hypothetical protein